jgi:DNA-binding CsgD family transcriptional regulator
VLVTDPEQAKPAAEAHLRALYGLTKAEARVAHALLDADHLADIAGHLGITLSTVRTRLQRTFEKTGTRRQSELARLLLARRLPASGRSTALCQRPAQLLRSEPCEAGGSRRRY